MNALTPTPSNRDQDLIADYTSGKEIPELTRIYGVCDRRVRQILAAQGVERRGKSERGKKQPLSGLHVSIGLRLYRHRQDYGIELHEMATSLEKSTIWLRKAEQGQAQLELLDLMAVASYLKITIQDLTEVMNNDDRQAPGLLDAGSVPSER